MTSDSHSEDERSLPERVINRVVGPFINPIVDNVDVSDVVDRIDVNDVVDRVDVDELVDRIDINAALDQVDVDRLLDRIDPDRLLDRIDPDRLLDRVDPDRLLERVDPDRLLDRVDPDRLLDRVDVNRMISRVDVEAIVQRVDVNEMVERVDVNDIMDRVDVNAVVERTELGDIIARSTTGVFTQILDVGRTQFMRVDNFAQGVAATILRRDPREAPGSPAGDAQVFDFRSMTMPERAEALQNRYAGSVSRFTAFLADQFIIGLVFGVLATLAAAALRVVTGTELNLDEQRVVLIVAFALWSFTYTAGSLAATGRTIGKALLGLLVLDADGKQLEGRRAAMRSIAFPLSFLLFGVGFLIGLIRRDRRELHDLIAGTAVVYSWDAHNARVRAQAENHSRHSSEGGPGAGGQAVEEQSDSESHDPESTASPVVEVPRPNAG